MKNTTSVAKILLMILGFWLVVGGVGYGLFVLNGGVIPLPIKSGEVAKNKPKPIIPKTQPLFLNQTKLLSESENCTPSKTSKSYSAIDGKYSYIINVLDTKAPFKEGYDITSLMYVNSFIDGNVPIQNEVNNVNRAFFYICGGYLSKQVDEITDEKYMLQNVEKSRSIFSLDSQEQGGNLFYYAVGKRGDYLIYLRVGAIGLESTDEANKACVTNDSLNQNCYENRIVTDVNKKSLLDEVEKALELTKFD
jgi:hypothetical protein